MSLLYPLFLAGIAAVSLPIVLHMIRRHTNRRVRFSTLMFLRTTAPRLKNRRRLEHLPLLILRCLILCLLALAFARPFIARPITRNEVQTGKRLVVLVDASASMRRTDMWEQALRETGTVLTDAGPDDRVCLMRFGQDAQTLVGFEQWASMAPGQRKSIALQQISELSPNWSRTELGQALVAAAEAIEDDEVNQTRQGQGQRQVVLVSDLQQGSDIEALKAYEWPEETELVVKLASPRGTTNATLRLMTDHHRFASSDGNTPVRIRVANSADATRERFQLGWADESSTTDVYVPPGRSVVVPAPARTQTSAAHRLTLTGDDHDFDNVLHIAPPIQQSVNILYLGDDEPNDPKGMLFYVRQAFDIDGPFAAQVSQATGDKALLLKDIDTANLIIVGGAVSEQSFPSLRRYLESGRALLLVMESSKAVTTLSGLTGIDSLTSREVDSERYAMLAQIDFDHPLLTPFSDPRFGDFTRIHFWKHRHVDLSDIPKARVLAQFDDNAPAWFEIPIGKGALFVWTSGWHPVDSDLALSSKFAPLLYSALEYSGTRTDRHAQYAIGDAVPVPIATMSGASRRQIRKPDGSVVNLDADQRVFVDTDIPGIYTAESATDTLRFAINLPARESRTELMPIEDLEKLGVSIGSIPDPVVVRTEQAIAQSSFSEMESEHKLWRWVIVVVLAMLLVEIWLAGWLTRHLKGDTHD